MYFQDAENTLNHQLPGTFILRLATVAGGLGISVKKFNNGGIQHILLTRTGKETYKIGKHNKEVLLFQFLRGWDVLQYLYAPPMKNIKKKFLF